MSKRFPWTLIGAVVFALVGCRRALLAIAMAPGPDLPALLFVCVVAEAAGALLAAAGLFFGNRIALAGLAVFAISAVVQMAGDVAWYGIRPLLDGLSGSLLALALAAFGWIVFERGARGGPAGSSPSGRSAESRA